MAQDPVIVLSAIAKNYGSVQAVRGIDLSVEAGEFLAIIGPSGCGKTSTLRMIAGLEVPSGGDIYIDSKRVNDVKPWKRDTPLVWQNFTLFPHMNVAENIEYGLRMRGVGRADRDRRVRKVVETVGLTGMETRSVLQLSGGQKQRVGLARAIVLDPKILLLDEPLGALDAKIGRSMQRELSRLHRELGITFVYVTHNQSEAMAMADRIVIMNDGRIEQIGAPHEVYRKPQSRFVAEFVGANNVITGEIASVSGDRASIVTPGGRFEVAVPTDRTVRVGEPAIFIVGADKIAIAGSGSEGPNRIAGRVVAAEFSGAVAQLFVETDQGMEFRVQKASSQVDETATTIGAQLDLSWSSDDTFLLPGGR